MCTRDPPSASLAEMERVAVLAGMVGIEAGSREVPSGRWVPQGSPAVGREYDPATHIAVPGNTARQRLIQSGRRYSTG